MGKLKILSGSGVCKILSNYGFVAVRQKGSHIIMQKKIEGTTITVPIPNHTEILKGSLKSIIRQSKISQSEFET